ncbi:MAG: phosphate ABC transporter substrate-binding protein PstS [Janthinobacterium lividum]
MSPLKAAIVSLACALAANAALAADLTGAGSTFAAPIYSKWADAYQKSGGARVNYQGIGSSGGIKQIIANTVDFAGSDAPMKDEELAKSGLVQFPTVVGGIVPVVNLPGVSAGSIVLTGAALGDIYLGTIKKWNDPVLVKLNPGVKLPDQEIAVVRRADGSGTTFIFSDYLSKVNAHWKSSVGSGSTVNWPVGLGGKGNDGVAAFVQRLPGAIGYVEYAYAKQNKMTYVDMVNAAGTKVKPDTDSFKAAAASADWSKTYYQILTDEPGKQAWPIVGATFVMLHATQANSAQGAETLKFFDWAFRNGAPAAAELDYVTLPAAVVEQIHNTWKTQIKDASGKSIAG